MCRTSLGRAGLLAAVFALAPSWAAAQPGGPVGFPSSGGGPTGYPGYAPHDESQLVTPLGSTRPEEGGFFIAGTYVMYRQTNPLKDQLIAVRGFVATDSSVLGIPGSQGTFIGSRTEALDTHQVSGPTSWEPGFRIEAGYKFVDGSTITLGALWLNQVKNTAVATLVPSGLNVGPNFAESFLTAYVYNFPPEFAGPPNKINVGNQFNVYGIWNGATVMTEAFEQRFSEYEATWRFVLYENENFRISSLVGPRITWIWDKYQWRTTDQDVNGALDPSWVALYSNVVSNRLYGIHFGCSQECYIGHGFAYQLDLQTALFINSVKETAKYELGVVDKPENKRAKRETTFVPELQGNLFLAWYPREGIQIRIGYDAMAFFNTISSPRPVDFNYGSLTPNYEKGFRLFDGWSAGLAINF